MFPGIGVFEMVVVGGLAILLFGSKLPEVARNIGRSYGELRRGLNDLKSNIDTEMKDTGRPQPGRMNSRLDPPAPVYDDRDEPTAPRLTPPDNPA